MFRRREKSPQDLPRHPVADRFGLERASLVAAILAFLLIAGEIVVVQYLQANHTVLSFFAIFDPVLTCVTALLALAGLILGLLVVSRKAGKRVLGILGITFNGLFLLLVLVFYAVNMVTWLRGGG